MADEKHHESHDAGHSSGHSHGGGGHGGGGHGGGGGHEEAHEGAPEWLISFADNVALMMGFFVILLAMNMKEPTAGGIGGKEEHGGQPNSKMLDAAIAIRQAFNSPVDLNSNNPDDLPLIRRIKQKQMNGETRDQAPVGDEPSVQAVRPGDYFRLGGSVNFDESSSLLSADALEQIKEVANHARGQRFIIEVKGHASAIEANPSPEVGFDLSYHRAQAVAQALQEEGITWEQMRLVAAGASDRIVQKAYNTKSSHSNQRVEMVLTDDTRHDEEYSVDPAAPQR